MQAQKRVFLVRWMVSANVEMVDPSDTVKLPNTCDKRSAMKLGPKMVTNEAHDFINCAIARRAHLDLEESNFLGVVVRDDDDDESDEESDEEDNDENEESEEEESDEEEGEECESDDDDEQEYLDDNT